MLSQDAMETGQLMVSHHPVQLTAPEFPAKGLEHSIQAPSCELLSLSPAGDQLQLKNHSALACEAGPKPLLPKSRGPSWCVPPGTLTTVVQRTARSPSSHVLTPQPIYFRAGQTPFPSVLCHASSGLLCIMRLENVVAYFSVIRTNSFIFILNSFPAPLRFWGVGILMLKIADDNEDQLLTLS